MTKMREKHYSIPWREWSRVPVDDVLVVLQRHRDRVLADGNEQVLVNVDIDWEGHITFGLIGLRSETDQEREQREAKEQEYQDTMKRIPDRHLKSALASRSREEVLALWESCHKK